MMYRYLVIIFLLSTIKTEFHLYQSDSISESDLYYHCLYHKVLNVDLEIVDEYKDIEYPYELIPYCRRPLVSNIENDNGSIFSSLTFEQLKQEQITARNLLSWSAPIDLVERYENYLNTSNDSLKKNGRFNNCTQSWFGPFCQYTFDSDQTFDQIVLLTFDNKGSIGEAIFRYTNLTCYVHLKCNRGASPLCLDWREICDGRIDCLDDGIDEQNCIELEMNECEKDEYRCQNGMCVFEQFLHDNWLNPDCLDNSDEKTRGYFVDDPTYYIYCMYDPAFRCEETRYTYLIRNFVCGDGEEMQFYINPDRVEPDILLNEGFPCINGRRDILFNSMTLQMKSSNFSSECALLLACATMWMSDKCESLFRNQRFMSIDQKCNYTNYIILPVLPILQHDIQFGYWMNRTISCYPPNDYQPSDFVCYNSKRCPLFSFTFILNNLTCFDLKKLNIFRFDQLVRLFHTCSTIDITGNETHCKDAFLFQCPGTSKCISKYRLVDGIDDCYGGADEVYLNSCDLNQKHRFQCTSENKCLSPILVNDHTNHCRNGEDEFTPKKKFSFQNYCNGYVQLSPELVDRHEETDETNCEQWPCNNQYTRCDGAWTCRNGADELGCNSLSKCYPDQHECISPKTQKIICLPLNRTGDGIIDCLGATDERTYCRSMRKNHFYPYLCWNSTNCIEGHCNLVIGCETEQDTSLDHACKNDRDIQEILDNLMTDEILKGSTVVGTKEVADFKYFSLLTSSLNPSNN